MNESLQLWDPSFTLNCNVGLKPTSDWPSVSDEDVERCKRMLLSYEEDGQVIYKTIIFLDLIKEVRSQGNNEA